MDQDICNLYVKYDDVVAKIAVIEYKIKSEDLSPSMAGIELLELSMEQWLLRRKINSASAKYHQNKPLWQRIFKK